MSASVPLMMFAEEDVEGGGKSIEDDFAYRNNVHQASLHIRLAFLRKVYSLLFIQLAATVVIGFTFMFTPILSFYIHNNDWLLSLSLILSVVILIALHWKRREYPTNLILLAAFTLIQAYSVGVVVTYFEQFVVLQALVLTVVVVGGLTAYTLQSKRDFSSLGSFYELTPALCLWYYTYCFHCCGYTDAGLQLCGDLNIFSLSVTLSPIYFQRKTAEG
ncbi:hypothetical protein J6590_022272 [Homalodisca vitripennis]|nr:hypothetical protein J6590_022272 [Homalodisca vitripennis]